MLLEGLAALAVSGLLSKESARRRRARAGVSSPAPSGGGGGGSGNHDAEFTAGVGTACAGVLTAFGAPQLLPACAGIAGPLGDYLGGSTWTSKRCKDLYIASSIQTGFGLGEVLARNALSEVGAPSGSLATMRAWAAAEMTRMGCRKLSD